MSGTGHPHEGGSVVALCGGIGGAKLALGLSRVVPPEKLTIIVNTADDFTHLGLKVSPDIDTVVYTLAGRANTQTGWGREGESWRFMEAVGELGGDTWFALGDTDLATSAVRTAHLAAGATLTQVTRDIARSLGVSCAVVPMSDDRVSTIVETDEGALPFQRYFVGRHCAPAVRGVWFEGAETARISPEADAALRASDISAIVLCPSNPYLSIDPMLAIPALRARLAGRSAPLVAVSPIVGGAALKGPLGKMMGELGLMISPQTVLAHYGDLIDRLVLDTADAGLAAASPKMRVAPSIMRTLDDRMDLARAVLAIAREAAS